MCIAALSDYDAETARQICELEAMLAERRRKQLERDPAMRARANRFMPAAGDRCVAPSLHSTSAAGSLSIQGEIA